MNNIRERNGLKIQFGSNANPSTGGVKNISFFLNFNSTPFAIINPNLDATDADKYNFGYQVTLSEMKYKLGYSTTVHWFAFGY